MLSNSADTCTIIIAGLSAYAAHDKEMVAARHQHRPKFHMDNNATDEALLRTISYLVTTIALVYCHKNGKEFNEPKENESLIGNMLIMMGLTDSADKTAPDGRIKACFERLWILYADHEMSCSTASILHAASTLTDPVSCIISGVVSAYGPLHGGAIELAYDAFASLRTPKNVPAYIAAVKAKQMRLFGYGHRIYKTKDPRVGLIGELMAEYRESTASDPLVSVALAIDEIANTDPYFVDRKLKVNADLYGCFLITAM